jgi:hypothetical protein
LNTNVYHPSTEVKLLLGRSKAVQASSDIAFRDLISPFLEAPKKQPKANGVLSRVQIALWPLVREIHIFCDAPVLRSGAVLIDLPGVSDNNAARDLTARKNLEVADKIFILSQIIRAANDKIAQGKYCACVV